jgi:integrase
MFLKQGGMHMDVRYLRDNHPKLIAYMEEAGYCARYVSGVRCEVGRILREIDSKGWDSYKDVYLEFAQRPVSQSYLRNKLTYLGVIERFSERGQYPDGRRRQGVIRRDKYDRLSPEFKSVIDSYCVLERARGKKKETSIYVESHSATSFLYALQQCGIVAPEKITEGAVLSVFMGNDGALRRSCSYKKNVKAVLKACAVSDPGVFDRITAFLPELRETRKNIQYLKPEEAALVKQALRGERPGLSFRDRAIGSLACYIGLRSCDIAALKAGDINWESELLCISQQKTGIPLKLPLPVAVGNAIHDYLAYERPSTASEYLFISRCRPCGGLASASIGNVANKIMKAAGIRQGAGERRGLHIFRHRVATELLGADIPQPVISRVLGHASPDSLEAYLSADFKHLKECALSIERFPIAKEVFADA